MQDEALIDLNMALINLETGLHWIEKEFQKRPTIGWSVDSFGHN